MRIGVDKPGADSDRMELPCGRCIGCKLDRSRMWTIRIGHEAQFFTANRFATFTYNDDSLPESLSLVYADFSGFMKRLRKRLSGFEVSPDGGNPIRFFMCGEYGGRTGRPHYHAILFNVKFEDEVRLANGTIRSVEVEDLWQKGNVVLGDVTMRSAAYVAGYTLKKVHGARAKEHYLDVVNTETGELSARRPEFVVMSRRPGIGAWWYRRWKGDLFSGDSAIVDGKKYKVPRYYWNKYKEEVDGGVREEIEYARFLKSQDFKLESTEARRLAREEIALRRAALYDERGL